MQGAGMGTAARDRRASKGVYSNQFSFRQRHRDATLQLQAHYRGDKARRKVRDLKASITLQRAYRGYHVRKDLDAIIFGWAAYDNVVTTLKQYVQDTPGLDIHGLFDDLDVDEGGDFTLYELQKFFLAHPALALDGTAAEALVYHIDSGRDGMVSKREFLRAFNNHKEKVGKIKRKWEQHEAFKRKKASDYHKREYEKAKIQAEKLKASLATQNKHERYNIDQMTKYKKMVNRHREKHAKSIVSKKKRLLSGHVSYRDESVIVMDKHASRTRRAKEAAIQRLRDANAGVYDESIFFPVPPNSGSPQSLSPRNRRVGDSRSREMSTASTVVHSLPPPEDERASTADNIRLFNTWKPLRDEKGHQFWQNVRTKEVAWTLPTGSLIQGMDDGWSSGYNPRLRYVPVFDEIPSKQWNSRDRRAKVKNTPVSINTLTVLTDDILSVGSIKFCSDNGRKLFVGKF